MTWWSPTMRQAGCRVTHPFITCPRALQIDCDSCLNAAWSRQHDGLWGMRKDNPLKVAESCVTISATCKKPPVKSAMCPRTIHMRTWRHTRSLNTLRSIFNIESLTRIQYIIRSISSNAFIEFSIKQGDCVCGCCVTVRTQNGRLLLWRREYAYGSDYNQIICRVLFMKLVFAFI